MTSEFPKPPLATYRLQFHKDFTFDDGGKTVSYLKRLGVSHLYASPVLESAAGSTHGYDVQDFGKVSGERGGEAALKTLDGALRDAGLAMLLDIVPNHMAANPLNPYWRDVLANGRASRYWTLFDMRVPEGDKIHLPVLAEDIRKLFDDGNLSVDFAAGTLNYFDTAYPLAPETPRFDGAAPNFAQFEQILAAQNYILMPWTDVLKTVSYRRFFDVTSLIGVRIEDEENFALAHAKLFSLMQEMPSITALRCDHIDGLADPQTYLERLKAHGLPIWVEKILGRDEKLVKAWPIGGTTGYEFIDQLNQLFTDAQGFKTIESFWRTEIDGQWDSFDACVTEGKTLVLNTLFPSEAQRLGKLSGDGDAEKEARAEAFWRAMAVALPVYRTYAGNGQTSDADIKTIRATAEKAVRHDPAFSGLAAEFLPGLLDPQTDMQRKAAVEWQQLSGPVMAKGLEDCSHYRYTPLMALNEVGCPASLPGKGAEAFFSWLDDISAHCPDTLKATSTHDTKRSEDARARLYALADMPEPWMEFWRDANAMSEHFKTNGAPGKPAEYILYQAIVSTWPLDGNIDDAYRKRIDAYMQKALHEARRDTSWLAPNAEYEKAVHDFIAAILSDADFMALTQAFCDRLSRAGAINALAVQAIKILTPGIPDIYQGTECWDFSLVDPDNRRPVDFAAHEALAAAVSTVEEKEGRTALLTRLTNEWRDGGIKQWLTAILLAARISVAPQSTAKQLRVTGAKARHIIAYSFGPLIVVVPRFPGRLLGENGLGIPVNIWEDTIIDGLPSAVQFTDLLRHRIMPRERAMRPGELFADFPVAVLQSEA